MQIRQHNKIAAEIGPIQVVAVSSITFPKSLRNYPNATIKKAARFIEALGLRLPILLDAKRNVVAGEIWALAAKALDLPEIPALFVEGFA